MEDATKRESSLAEEIGSLRASHEGDKLKLMRVEEQLRLAKDRASTLSGEVDARVKEVQDVRARAVARETELLTDLSRARAEGDGHAKSQALSKSELDSVRALLHSCQEELKEVRAKAAREVDQALREKSLSDAVMESQKRVAGDSARRVSELEVSLRALQEEANAALAQQAAQAQAAMDAQAATAAAEREALQSALRDSRARVAELESALASSETRLQEAVAQASATPAGRVLAALDADASPASTATSVALELLRRSSVSSGAAGVTATEIYARITAAEQALQGEKAESARLRSYLSTILAEIEAKAPVIAQQRKDYERALVSHEELSKRLMSAMQEVGSLQAAVARVTGERDAAVMEMEAQRRSLQDQAAQIATLLAERVKDKAAASGLASSSASVAMLAGGAGGEWEGGMGGHGSAFAITGGGPMGGDGPAWPADDKTLLSLVSGGSAAAGGGQEPLAALERVIAEHLVTYTDVLQLQHRNAQLLRLLRRLARTAAKHGLMQDVLSESGAPGGSSPVASSSSTALTVSGLGGSASTGQQPAMEALKGLMAELAELRQARERQARVVSGVVQQRDMYRLLLAQTNSTAVRNADAQARAIMGGDSMVGAGAGSSSALLIGATPGGAGGGRGGAGMGSPAGGDAGGAMGAGEGGAGRMAPLSMSSLGGGAGGAASGLGGSLADVSALQAALSAAKARIVDLEASTRSAMDTSSSLSEQLEGAHREVERVRGELSSLHASSSTQVEAMRAEVTGLRSQIAGLQSEAKFQSDRGAMLGGHVTSLREEAAREAKRSTEMQVRSRFHSPLVHTAPGTRSPLSLPFHPLARAGAVAAAPEGAQ